MEVLSSAPIVYTDQRKKKVFIMEQDCSRVYQPDQVLLEDQDGRSLSIPKRIQGNMTVLDVKNIASGGYLLRILDFGNHAIKVILF